MNASAVRYLCNGREPACRGQGRWESDVLDKFRMYHNNGDRPAPSPLATGGPLHGDLRRKKTADFWASLVRLPILFIAPTVIQSTTAMVVGHACGLARASRMGAGLLCVYNYKDRSMPTAVWWNS